MARTYPCKAFTLTSGYNVRSVALERPYSSDSDQWGAYTKNGKFYPRRDLFDTKAAAIKAGRKKIARIQKNLDHAAAALRKHAATLDKAEGIASQTTEGGSNA